MITPRGREGAYLDQTIFAETQRQIWTHCPSSNEDWVLSLGIQGPFHVKVTFSSQELNPQKVIISVVS